MLSIRHKTRNHIIKILGKGKLMGKILGTGAYLRRIPSHPYIDVEPLQLPSERALFLEEVNRTRCTKKRPGIEVTYYFEADRSRIPIKGKNLFYGLLFIAQELLNHGTVSPYHEPEPKPPDFDLYMSFVSDVQFLGLNEDEGIEAGLIKVFYPRIFFDHAGDGLPPLAQLELAFGSEPYSGFIYYQNFKVVDIQIDKNLCRELGFPGPQWPHARVRRYLGKGDGEPIIGAILKPKTGTTPTQDAHRALMVAEAGGDFFKWDENKLLTLDELKRYVSKTCELLVKHGFNLDRTDSPAKNRFIFAPHITSNPRQIHKYAEAALEEGANALMFSPWLSGGLDIMRQVAQEYDVMVYAHTAGMNRFAGYPLNTIDARVTYYLAALMGASFMQIPAPGKGAFIKPFNFEKGAIIKKLAGEGLLGENGMTLVVAGGINPKNIGQAADYYGTTGFMYLSGRGIMNHPDGVSSGVEACKLAYRAWLEEGITDEEELKDYAIKLGNQGLPLLRALENF